MRKHPKRSCIKSGSNNWMNLSSSSCVFSSKFSLRSCVNFRFILALNMKPLFVCLVKPRIVPSSGAL